jgi:hypothetical protein
MVVMPSPNETLWLAWRIPAVQRNPAGAPATWKGRGSIVGAMSDLDFLRAQVPDFEGYADEEARHHTDQRVRATIGSALARVEERLSGELEEKDKRHLEQVLLRCQFPDQHLISKLDRASFDERAQGELAQVDRELVDLADRFPQATATSLPGLLDETDALFDRRARSPAPAV